MAYYITGHYIYSGSWMVKGERAYKQRILLINVYRQFFFFLIFNSVFLCFLDFSYELTESDFYVLLICDTKTNYGVRDLNNFSKRSMLLRKVLIKEAYSGHVVDIISYKFLFRFTKYTFSSIFLLSVSLKTLNIILMCFDGKNNHLKNNQKKVQQ